MPVDSTSHHRGRHHGDYPGAANPNCSIAALGAAPFFGLDGIWDTARITRAIKAMAPMTISHIQTPRSRSDPSRKAGFRRTGGHGDSATGSACRSIAPDCPASGAAPTGGVVDRSGIGGADAG